MKLAYWSVYAIQDKEAKDRSITLSSMPARSLLVEQESLRQVMIYFHPTVWSQMRYLKGISESSARRKWSIRIGRIGSLLRELATAKVRLDGIIACTPDAEDAGWLRQLSSYGVGISTPERDWCKCWVDVDDRAIGLAAAEHFLERGFRHVAAVPTQFAPAYADRRVQAFCQRMMRNGIKPRVYRYPANPRLFIPGSIVQWLRRGGLPVAVFGVDDLVALQILRACLLAGLRVPQDVAVLGAENLEEISMTSMPPLSSVDVPMEQMGFRAAEILQALMEGKEPEARFPMISPTSVITRASTDALAVNDALLARAYAFLRDNLGSGISVRDLERHLHAGRRQIERRTAEGWGCTPMEMIQRMRVTQAKQLLAHTDRTIDDIAQAAGFTGARALLKQFKRQMRITPSEFRAEHRASGDCVSS